MTTSGRHSWWAFGIVVALSFSLATLVRLMCFFIQTLSALVGPGDLPSLSRLLTLAAIVFGIGFACGCVVWVLQPMSTDLR